MKALIFLFIAICLCGIGWRYADKAVRRGISKAIRQNLMTILMALVTVAMVVFFSVNTTVRLV